MLSNTVSSDHMTIEVLCPICKKYVTAVVPRLSESEIKSVAFNHGDHVLVLEYDFEGNIRSIYAMKINKMPVGKEITCPRCGMKVNIPETESQYEELAYVHDDHVLIVYLFNKDTYITDVIDLAPGVEVLGRKNIISQLIDILGSKNLANVLFLAFFDQKSIIPVPKEALYLTRKLLVDLGELNMLRVQEGEISELPKLELPYIESLLFSVKNLPEREAIQKLSLGIKLALKLTAYVIKFNESGHKELADEILSMIQDTFLKSFIKDLVKIYEKEWKSV